MRFRSLLYLFVFWLLVLGNICNSRTGQAEEPIQLTSPEQKVLCPEHLKNGDYDKLIAEWFEFIQANPDHPLVELIIRSLQRYPIGHQLAVVMPVQGGDEAALIARVKEILKRDIQNGTNRLLLLRYLVSLYEKQGDWQSQKRLASKLGFINNWVFIGPWGFTDLSVFDESFPPEEEILFGKTYPAHRGWNRSLSWRLLPPRSKFEAGEAVNFFSFSRPRAHGAIYGLTQFQVEQPGEAWVIIHSNNAYKVWFNDNLLFVADRLRSILPREITLPITLTRGWNRLMIKTISGLESAFTVQLVKPDGISFDDLNFEPALKLHPVVKPDVKTNRFYATPPLVGNLKYYAELVAKQPKHPYLLLVLGLLYHYLGDYDKALHFCPKAIEIQPDSPYLSYYLAQVYKTSDFLPMAYARNRTKELVDRVISLEPDFLPAYLIRADYYLSFDKPEEALAELERAFRSKPDFRAGYYLAADICSAQGWEYEADKMMEKLNELDPDNITFLIYQAESYARQQNYPAALELYEKIRARDSSVCRPAGELGWPMAPYRHGVRSLYRRMGKLDLVIKELQEILSYKPNHLRILRDLARLYTHRGNYQSALKYYEQITKLVPEDDRVYEKIGDLYLKLANQAKRQSRRRRDKLRPATEGSPPTYRRGDLIVTEALKHYQTALRLNPSHSQLRRYINSLTGEDEDFSKPYIINVRDLIPGAPGASKFPQADVVYLVDQAVLRIYEDGSYSEIIHQAYKILTEKGIDEYSVLDVPGEILEARTHLPNGTIMEPVYLGSGLGNASLTMPRVEIGSVVEYKYRADTPRAYDGQFRFPRFYFQDPYFDAPFLISQFVVIAPCDFPLKIAQRNLSLNPTIKYVDDLKVHAWTVTESERLEPESHMPHINEILPYVMVAEARDWSDIHRVYQSRLAGLRRCIVTELIRQSQKEQHTKRLLRDPEAIPPGPVHSGQPKKLISDCSSGKKAEEGRVYTERSERVPSLTLRQKVEALYYFVNQEIKEKSGGALTAQDILLTKKGNRLILLKTLLDAAGIESYFVLVRAPARLAPEPEWSIPRPEYFTDEDSVRILLQVPLVVSPLVGVHHGAESTLYLSGDHRYLVCGDLPDLVQGGRGFLIGPVDRPGNANQIIPIPQLPPESQSSSTELNFTVNFVEEGLVPSRKLTTEVTGLISFRGLANAQSKASFSLMDEPTRRLVLQKVLNNHFPGLRLKQAYFHHLHQLRQPLRLEFTFSLPHFLIRSSQGELHCKLGLTPINLTGTFISERVRKFPLQISQDFYNHDRVRISLASHLLPENLPGRVNLVTDFGTYSLTISMVETQADKGKVIELERLVRIPAQQILPARYQDFIKFCKQIDQAEAGRIELRQDLK